MRENRTSGSEGGEAQINELSLPLSPSSRRVLIPQGTQESDRILGDFPGIRPEAQIDGPPVGRTSAAEDFRNQLVKIEIAGPERVVG